jgi:hypothetical protein
MLDKENDYEQINTLKLQCPYLFFNVNNGGGWHVKDKLMWLGGPVGKGWSKIVKDLSIKLEGMITKKYIEGSDINVMNFVDNEEITDEDIPWPRVVQIKEKFGSLRFYLNMHAYDEELEAEITKAEKLSAVTCEFCGAPGEIQGPGWLKCRCEDCKSKDSRETYAK